LLLACALAGLPAQGVARTLEATVERVDSAVAQLSGVRVRLDWPARATEGRLRLRADRLDAPGLGYAFRDVTWQCVARRDGEGGWTCDGPVRGRGGAAMRLAVALGRERTHARLAMGGASIDMHRRAAAPDLTAIDLVDVPAAWAQAMVARAWADPAIGDGRLDARLQVDATGEAVRVHGDLGVRGLAFDTPDATIAGQGLAGRFALDWRKRGGRTDVALEGQVLRGEFLAGRTYVALDGPAEVRLAAIGQEGGGWRLPSFSWRDGGALVAEGNAAFGPDATLRDLRLDFRSPDAGSLARRYLSGWLAPLGLGAMEASGALDGEVVVSDAALSSARIAFHGVDLADVREGDEAARVALSDLQGTLRFTAGATPVDSRLRWSGGALYGLPFGASTLAFRSVDGVLGLQSPAAIPAFGGAMRIDSLALRPARAGSPMQLEFGLTLDALDIGRLSRALGWPDFQGTLSGRIPAARYAGDRLDFDGGLDVELFGGRVQVSELSMERPFGSAPSLSADLAIDDLDLQSLTGVFGFGSISGRLDGRIDDLRLVDWRATAFDAHLYTDRSAGVRQRISQRAVQNISSVGDASFASSLQGRLIGIFDDFGYSAIGIRCRLRNEVCEMGGLRSGGDTFTIVAGAGLPHLTVVGHNRLVDWPVLVERLAAVGAGDVKPVID
jgi:hypothetical protein